MQVVQVLQALEALEALPLAAKTRQKLRQKFKVVRIPD
jgi:hypothetical protein